MLRAVLTSLLIGCSGSTPTGAELHDCADGAAGQACRDAWAVATWPEDPDAVAQAIAAETDPVRRIAWVNHITEAFPGGTSRLCDALDAGPAKERCFKVNTRGHLMPFTPGQAGRSTAPSELDRPGGGPATTRLEPPPDTPSPLAEVAALAESAAMLAQDRAECTDAPDAHSCVNRIAKAAAEAGDAAAAAGACKTIATKKWATECSFAAAEAAVITGGAAAYGGAVDLCLVSGDFAANCQAHLLGRLAALAPDATAAARDWQPAVQAAEGIAAAWQDRVPGFAPLALDRFWSDALAFAYAKARPVTGDPLADGAVPPRFHRHVRAAAASRLLVVQGRMGPRSLEQWSAALSEALDRREGATDTRRRGDTRLRPAEDTWIGDQPEDRQRPATFYLGTARRTWSEDAEADGLICLLEAAARWQPHGRPLLAEGAEHEDQAVRWTAERLLAAQAMRDAAPSHQPPRGSLPPLEGG